MQQVYVAKVARLPFAAVDQVNAANFKNYLRKRLAASGKYSKEEIPKMIEEAAGAAKKFFEDLHNFEELTGLAIKAEYPPNEGSFAKIPAMDLALIALEAIFKDLILGPECVDVFRLGAVIAPKTDESWVHAAAKVIALKAGMRRANTFTEDKACSSGTMAVGLAYDAIAHHGADVAVACGVDKMSGVPDRLVRFGLTNPVEPGAGKLMVALADEVAQELGITREELDDYAFDSHERAKNWQGKHRFIVPVKVSYTLTIDRDEAVDKHPITRQLLARLPTYPQSEGENAPKCGVVTAGNSARYADSASAMLLTSRRGLRMLKLDALARVLAFAEVSGPEPKNFILKSEEAIGKCLMMEGLSWEKVGHFEVNEASSVGNRMIIKLHDIERDRMNRRGGAVAHGHAIGCTGCSLCVKSVDISLQDGDEYYVVATCDAVDEAAAILFENPYV